jgi:hypothetical protein
VVIQPCHVVAIVTSYGILVQRARHYSAITVVCHMSIISSDDFSVTITILGQPLSICLVTLSPVW